MRSEIWRKIGKIGVNSESRASWLEDFISWRKTFFVSEANSVEFLVDWSFLSNAIFSTEIVDQLLGLLELPEELIGKPCKPRPAWL